MPPRPLDFFLETFSGDRLQIISLVLGLVLAVTIVEGTFVGSDRSSGATLDSSHEEMLRATPGGKALPEAPLPPILPDVVPGAASGERSRTAPLVQAPVPRPLTPGPGYNDTSEFYIGSVAVGVFLVESAGSAYDWSDGEVTQTLDGIYSGLAWWASVEPKARLSFSYELHIREPTTWEPIQNSLDDDWLWIDEIMTNLGYRESDPWNKTLHFNNDLRARLGTDWAYSIFVADSNNTVNLGRFTNNEYAAAYLGGPWVTMSRYSSWAYNSADYYRVVPAHETGHIFYATDEYDTDPVEYSGYLKLSRQQRRNWHHEPQHAKRQREHAVPDWLGRCQRERRARHSRRPSGDHDSRSHPKSD